MHQSISIYFEFNQICYISRLAACVNDYFEDEEIRDEKSSRYPIYKGYKTVLDSKSTEESQVYYHLMKFQFSKQLKILNTITS